MQGKPKREERISGTDWHSQAIVTVLVGNLVFAVAAHRGYSSVATAYSDAANSRAARTTTR
jgi:hypothetical protein